MDETRGIWRGKHDDIDSSEWIAGYLIKMWGKFCLQDPQCENRVDEIDPSTLGECTGLTDKNGKLIFEGDIISFMESTEKYYVTKWDKENACFYYDRDVYVKSWCASQYGIIVGNIHDNPELIKGDENNG